MVNSAKAVNGAIANENYARELMQLFTLGTELLNDDGTPKLDGGGHIIATYDQPTIQAFARAFTGWTYKAASGPQGFPSSTSHADWNISMVPFVVLHATNAQTLPIMT